MVLRNTVIPRIFDLQYIFLQIIVQSNARDLFISEFYNTVPIIGTVA